MKKRWNSNQNNKLISVAQHAKGRLFGACTKRCITPIKLGSWLPKVQQPQGLAPATSDVLGHTQTHATSKLYFIHKHILGTASKTWQDGRYQREWRVYMGKRCKSYNESAHACEIFWVSYWIGDCAFWGHLLSRLSGPVIAFLRGNLALAYA